MTGQNYERYWNNLRNATNKETGLSFADLLTEHITPKRILGLFSGFAETERAILNGESRKILPTEDAELVLVDKDYAQEIDISGFYAEGKRKIILVAEDAFDYVKRKIPEEDKYDLVVITAIEYLFDETEPNRQMLEGLSQIVIKDGIVLSYCGLNEEDESLIDPELWEVILKDISYIILKRK